MYFLTRGGLDLALSSWQKHTTFYFLLEQRPLLKHFRILVRESFCQLLYTGHLLSLTAVYNTDAPPANYPNQHRQAMFFNRLHSHSGQQGYALTQQTCNAFKQGPLLNTL